MVPIYSLDAWLALRFVDARFYLDPVRECYEAYAIYSFYAYLMSYLEDELGDVDAYLSTKPQVPHLKFVTWLGLVDPWPMGAPFLYEIKKGVANYVIARPLCTALAAVADALGVYGEGQILRFDRLYPYLAFFVNFSQAWALYCLVLFYHAFAAELAPIRPLAKFVCIKAVVFLTFWQGLALHLLGALGLLPRDEQVTTYTAADVAEGYQDFFICVEMFLASVAHAWAFSYRDYRDDSLPVSGDFVSNLRAMFDLRDVARDVRGVVEDHIASAAQAGRAAAEGAGGRVAEGAGAVAAAVPRALAKAGGAVLGATTGVAAPAARGIYQHLVGGGGGGAGGAGGGGGSGGGGEEEQEEAEEEAAALLASGGGRGGVGFGGGGGNSGAGAAAEEGSEAALVTGGEGRAGGGRGGRPAAPPPARRKR